MRLSRDTKGPNVTGIRESVFQTVGLGRVVLACGYSASGLLDLPVDDVFEVTYLALCRIQS
jgi:hypothetical protein